MNKITIKIKSAYAPTNKEANLIDNKIPFFLKNKFNVNVVSVDGDNDKNVICFNLNRNLTEEEYEFIFDFLESRKTEG